MIVFSAFTPHTPLLIERIGKENYERLEKTRSAMDLLAEELYAARPDTIIVISAHTDRHEDTFSVNVHDSYGVDLTDFGDYATERTFRPDMKLIDRMQRGIRQEKIPITLNSNENLDYGSAVPLLLLTENLKNVRVVPVSYSSLDKKDHVEFGRALKNILERSERRVAVIASGDLAHCLSDDAPVGYRPEGEVFDNTMQEAIKSISTSTLLTLDEKVIEQSAECAYRPLLILFGVLERTNIQPKILSYEAPFGVGYLTVQFQRL